MNNANVMALTGDAMPEGQTGVYWFPQEKIYFAMPGGGADFKPCDITNAFTLQYEGIIIICPARLFGFKRSLRQYKTGKRVINNGDKMDDFYSVPGILLHEMAHLVNVDSKSRLPLCCWKKTNMHFSRRSTRVRQIWATCWERSIL